MNIKFKPISINKELVSEDIQECIKENKCEDYLFFFVRYYKFNLLNIGFYLCASEIQIPCS